MEKKIFNTEIVGEIRFNNEILNVYNSLNDPLFKANDVAKLIGYGSTHNTWKMLNMCEEDEKLILPLVVSGQRRSVSFVNELGLYNILSQSRKPIARKWRRIVHDEIIKLRKSRSYSIIQQFDDWDEELDTLFIDEETGILMQSVTVEGGDVEQIPYES